MGRRRKERALDLWMNRKLGGHWTLGSQAQHEFNYADSWLASATKKLAKG